MKLRKDSLKLYNRDFYFYNFLIVHIGGGTGGNESSWCGHSYYNAWAGNGEREISASKMSELDSYEVETVDRLPCLSDSLRS